MSNITISIDTTFDIDDALFDYGSPEANSVWDKIENKENIDETEKEILCEDLKLIGELMVRQKLNNYEVNIESSDLEVINGKD